MPTIKKYMWIAHLFVIAVCSYFIAQTVTTYIAMILEKGSSTPIKSVEIANKGQTVLLSSVDAYDVIAKRNVFNSEELLKGPKIPPGPPPGPPPGNDDAVKTSLNIKVLGTLVVDNGEDRRSSTTVVGGKSRKPDVYYVKGPETFEEGVELLRVKKDRIEFANKGRLEYALLEGVNEDITIFAKAEDVHGIGKETKAKNESSEDNDKPGNFSAKKTGEDSFVIDQREVDEALTNLDKLYTEIRIVPNFKGGQPAGMKILAVKPGSIFSKLGLRRGDILERINGLDLDIKQGMQLFSKLKDEKNLRIDLVRRGQNKTLEYEIR